jgi:DNA-binding transcriptional LysR family regulator
MTSNTSWEHYRAFLGVLETGSLSGAARALGLSQPTVGRHIATLEQDLGAVLFTRSQTGLLPTETALALRDHAVSMHSAAAAMERVVTSIGTEIAGTVRITASEVIGVEVLPPLVAQLRERHPALKLELVLTNRIQDLLRREADIAVRMQRPSQEQLVARRIGNIELGLFAHDRYLARCGTPLQPRDLGAHTLIGFDQLTAFLREASRSLPGMTREAFALRTDSDLAQLAMIRAGAGIGMCQAGLARREPALRRLLPSPFSMQLDTWITMHEDLRHVGAYRATFDALAQALADYIGEEPDAPAVTR